MANCLLCCVGIVYNLGLGVYLAKKILVIAHVLVFVLFVL